MASYRAYAAVRSAAVSAVGRASTTRSIIVGFDCCNGRHGLQRKRQKSSTATESGASRKNQRAVGGDDKRDFGTGYPAATTSPEIGALSSPAGAAESARHLKQRKHLADNADGPKFAAPPSGARSSLHDPFMARGPIVQQKPAQKPAKKSLGSNKAQAQTSASASAAATATSDNKEDDDAGVDRLSPPEFSNPVEVFPLDTELRREIGAAVDREMHRELGAALAAATVDPGAALHPEVADRREQAVAEGKAAGTGGVNFDDAAASYSSFTNMELVRAYVVLRACAIRPLVENSETLLKLGYGVIGETLTNSILGKTFFAHFCAGETAEQVGRCAGALKTRGIGGILDYAAEVDLRPAEERAEREAKKKAAGDDRLLLEEPAACRTYDYMGEAACDARMMTFLTCVRAVRDQTPGGFAAVKLTALGDPVLLAQIATCAHLVRKLFEDFDGDQDGLVSHEEFKEGYRRWFVSETEEDNATLLGLMKRLDPRNTGVIDYVRWSNQMRLDNLAEISAHCRIPGPMAAAALGDSGVALKKAMHRRIETLAVAAAASGVRLMIDAEQSWLQPAIDNEVYSLQLEFNTEFPTIFTTYQCYLKDSLERLKTDLDRATRGGYVWAGKLVRGAYMVSERERAEEEGYESPVFDTIEETHASYDAAVTLVLEHMAAGNRAEVMMATHNQASIEHAIALMQKLGIRRQDGVSFGQLLGMADNITFPLGAGGYKVRPGRRLNAKLCFLIAAFVFSRLSYRARWRRKAIDSSNRCCCRRCAVVEVFIGLSPSLMAASLIRDLVDCMRAGCLQERSVHPSIEPIRRGSRSCHVTFLHQPAQADSVSPRTTDASLTVSCPLDNSAPRKRLLPCKTISPTPLQLNFFNTSLKLPHSL
ncbi:unnamed protein product, partial [Scytosiphon promiscuus]